MNKTRLRFVASLAFAPLILSSATLNNDTFTSSTKVYVTYDAGIGTFTGGKKSITYTVAKGRKFKDLGNDEKPSDPIAPTNYTFKYYTYDDKEILANQPFNENTTITAYYSYKKPSSKPTTSAEAQNLWDNCSWEQLCSIAEEGFGDSSGDGLIGYFGLWKPTKNDFVGLTKALTYNEQTYTARVIGIEHDELANGEGAAALTFEFTNLIPGLSYDGYGHNSNVWSTSTLRNYLNGNEFGNLIDSGIKNNAKKIVKTTNAGNRAGTNAVDYSEDVFFPLSLKEMGVNEYPYQYIDSISASCNKTDLKDGDTVTKDMFNVTVTTNGKTVKVTDFDCNPALPYTLQSTDVPSKTFKISYKDKSFNVENVPVAKIERSIKVTLTDPTKMFDVGGSITTDDVKVQAVYSDGTTSVVGSESYTTDITLPYTFKETDRGSKVITFTKTDTGKQFKLSVNVGLTDLTITPAKTTYVVGDTIEYSDFNVVANYGSTKTIALTKDQYSVDLSLPYMCLNSDIESGKTINFTYGTITKPVSLNVKHALIGISVYRQNGIQHIAGGNKNPVTEDWFDVMLQYSDGEGVQLKTGFDCNYTLPYPTSKPGTYNFVISYQGFSDDISYTISDKYYGMYVYYDSGSWYTKGDVMKTEHFHDILCYLNESGSNYDWIYEGDAGISFTPDLKTGYTVTEEDVTRGYVPVIVHFTDVNGNKIDSEEIQMKTYSSTNGLKSNNIANNNNSNNALSSNNLKSLTNNTLKQTTTSNGSPYVVEEEGSTYEYYKNSTASTRRKKILDSSSYSTYWARSPETLTYSFAWGINSAGNVGVYNKDYKEYSPIDVREANAVAPCFAIGKVKQTRVAIENNNQSIVSSHNPRNILWEEQYSTKLSLNTNKYLDLAKHCEMFDISDTINPANLMVAIGYDNSKVDPSNGYKRIIPLSRVSELSATDVGYKIVSNGEANPTYTLTVSSPDEIYNKLGLTNKTCFAGIYVMANAVITDDWTTIYNNGKNNQYYLSSMYAPGVTKDISMTIQGEGEAKTYTTRLIGIKEDVTSNGITNGLTFELYSPVASKVGYNAEGAGNAWDSSYLRQTLINMTDALKAATANQDFTGITKKTVSGNGSSEIVTNEETIFALSPSEMGISQADYTSQHFQNVSKDNSIISSEGRAYSYYSNHSFFMNNLLRYKVSNYSCNDIWLRSPVATSPNNCFYLTNYTEDSTNYVGQVKSGSYFGEHYVCPCFAI